MFGLGDDIQDLMKEANDAVNLLIQVAHGSMGREAVLKWLIKEYPEKCEQSGLVERGAAHCSHCRQRILHKS